MSTRIRESDKAYMCCKSVQFLLIWVHLFFNEWKSCSEAKKDFSEQSNAYVFNFSTYTFFKYLLMFVEKAEDLQGLLQNTTRKNLMVSNQGI